MDQIIKLLQDFQEYSKTGHGEDLGRFGAWLHQKYTDDSAYLTDEQAVNEQGLDVMTAYVLCGLSSYIDTWVKLTYQDLPINSLGDFGILKMVEYAQNPSKKMIAAGVIMEKSTCNESIKRLVEKGILLEETDPQDRRIKRVKLSPQGHELNTLLDTRMKALGKFMMGHLDESEKKAILPPLNKLLQHHEYLYREVDRQEIKKNHQL